jgi:peptide/nickel transport system permease protein
VACGAGIVLGLVSGFYGGRADSLIMRVADVFMAYPFMLLTISVIAVLGNSILNLILVLGLSDWVTYARTIRGSVLSLKEKEFVMAARSVGTPNRVILTRHVFPNVLSPILVLATVRVANIIIWESGLSFLGMGVPPPMPTWGRMLAEGRVYITDAWWLVTLPGLAIMLTILSINLLGDGLRDALDPRLRNL